MKVLVIGSAGKMGKLLCNTLKALNINHFGIDRTNRESINFKPTVIVDFSSCEALKYNLDLAKLYNCPFIIATTGHSEENLKLIETLSKKIPIFVSANFSLQFNVLLKMLQSVKFLNKDKVVIEETHHIRKKDAPSGSAKMIYNELIHMNINAEVLSIRAGNIVGEHSVKFFAENEVLEIKHTALSRQLFCDGAVKACKFIENKQPGLYTMKDLLKYDNK